MRLIDANLKGNVIQYILQCIIATAALMLVLFYMDIGLDTTIVASIGATSFIIFTMPNTKRAKAFYILGGYAVGTLVGVVANTVLLMELGVPINILGALTVGISMFIMVITNTEHPPASALALAIAINGYTSKSIIFVYGVAISLLMIKWILRKWLINLW
jgi:CBS-domain-containing membrane protein